MKSALDYARVLHKQPTDEAAFRSVARRSGVGWKAVKKQLKKIRQTRTFMAQRYSMSATVIR